MADASDEVEDVSMEDEAALLYRAAYAIASEQPDARGGLRPTVRATLPGGFSVDLRRLRDCVGQWANSAGGGWS
jgi:hypothetical protein